mmetsp:Transcript_27999/g.84429  ORF Transcript_27999/g.84429 Transcript_27999/m.84429 type:complete len:148 (+) Transcript_27999:155-598(+)
MSVSAGNLWRLGAPTCSSTCGSEATKPALRDVDEEDRVLFMDDSDTWRSAVDEEDQTLFMDNIDVKDGPTEPTDGLPAWLGYDAEESKVRTAPGDRSSSRQEFSGNIPPLRSGKLRMRDASTLWLWTTDKRAAEEVKVLWTSDLKSK